MGACKLSSSWARRFCTDTFGQARHTYHTNGVAHAFNIPQPVCNRWALTRATRLAPWQRAWLQSRLVAPSDTHRVHSTQLFCAQLSRIRHVVAIAGRTPAPHARPRNAWHMSIRWCFVGSRRWHLRTHTAHSIHFRNKKQAHASYKLFLQAPRNSATALQ